jgi:protein disulfide-isomerase A1
MFYLVAILITPDYRLAPLKAFVNATKTLPAGYVFCHVHDTKLAGILGIDKEESALLVYSKHEDIPDATDEERKKWLTYTHKFKGDIRSSDEINGFLQLYSWRGWFYVDDTKFQKLSRRKDRYPTIMLLYNASRNHSLLT